MEEMKYVSPSLYVFDILTEGVLCTSGDDPTETLGENFGTWG